jgi:hypothetical protein
MTMDAGSPGIIRKRMKTSVAMMKKVMTISMTLRRTKRCNDIVVTSAFVEVGVIPFINASIRGG